MSAKFKFDYSKPFICTAVHNGHKLNDLTKSNLGISEADQLREEDPYTSFFTEICPNTIIAEYSRFEADLNRPEDRAVYIKPEDAWGLPVRKETPSEEQLKASYSIYENYYSELKQYLDAMKEKYEKFLVLDNHSYNHHRLGPGKEYDDPEKNPEIIIGTSNLTEKWFPIVKEFQSAMLEEDYIDHKIDARINVKFPGGYFPRWINHFYPDSAMCLAIEFKKTFMDEWTGKLDIDRQRRLREILQKGVDAIIRHFG